MNWFKRLCLFVFGLCGLLALAALCLTWVGPWTSEARTLLLEVSWYFLMLEVLVCIAAVGLVVCLAVSLFAPRNPRETIVADVNGGQITVTRAAIVSQTRHVVEADGTCIANAIRVRVRKRGNVRVHVRVTPRYPVDVVACGEALYAKLGEGLSQVCGSSIKSIDVVFTEPESLNGGQGFSQAEQSFAEGTDVSVPLSSHAYSPAMAVEGHEESAEAFGMPEEQNQVGLLDAAEPVTALESVPEGEFEVADQDVTEV